jgi:hypothetical protein
MCLFESNYFTAHIVHSQLVSAPMISLEDSTSQNFRSLFASRLSSTFPSDNSFVFSSANNHASHLAHGTLASLPAGSFPTKMRRRLRCQGVVASVRLTLELVVFQYEKYCVKEPRLLDGSIDRVFVID